MSQLLGSELTDELYRQLKGEAVAHVGKAIVIVTVDESGWAHPAVLSYHEIVAKDRRRIDVALGRTSTTARNLRRTGKITLIVTDKGMNFYLKGSGLELRESLATVPFMSLFRVELEKLLEDQEPGAVITTGVTFQQAHTAESREVSRKVFQEVLAEPLK
jgi:hypothetical protein